jgi:hypothetical protein
MRWAHIALAAELQKQTLFIDKLCPVDHRLAAAGGTARTAAAADCQTRVLVNQQGGVASALSW